jgi:hypothetical protein
MAEPAHLLYIINGAKEAWYKLSKEERNKLMAKCGEATKKFGGERLFNSKAPAGGPMFGAVAYPDMDSLIKSMEAHAEFDWPDKYLYVTQLTGIKS